MTPNRCGICLVGLFIHFFLYGRHRSMTAEAATQERNVS